MIAAPEGANDTHLLSPPLLNCSALDETRFADKLRQAFLDQVIAAFDAEEQEGCSWRSEKESVKEAASSSTNRLHRCCVKAYNWHRPHLHGGRSLIKVEMWIKVEANGASGVGKSTAEETQSEGSSQISSRKPHVLAKLISKPMQLVSVRQKSWSKPSYKAEVSHAEMLHKLAQAKKIELGVELTNTWWVSQILPFVIGGGIDCPCLLVDQILECLKINCLNLVHTMN